MHQRRSPPRLHHHHAGSHNSNKHGITATAAPPSTTTEDVPTDIANTNHGMTTSTSTTSSMATLQQVWDEIERRRGIGGTLQHGDEEEQQNGTDETEATTTVGSLRSHLGSGWTTDEASQRREEQGGYNVVPPPVDCPPWLCLLLPCIKHVPSMKAFSAVRPEDAEVLRNGRWIRYDASSLVVGDVIRMEGGDVVPADCVVVHVGDGKNGLEPDGSGTDVGEELLVDLKAVTGQSRPRVVVSSDAASSSGVQQRKLYMGGTVVQGRATALVTGVGLKTLLGKLIREGRFPPSEEVWEAAAAASVGTGGTLTTTTTGIQLGSIA